MANRANPLSRSPVVGALVFALAVLEVAWFAWFLIEPLPDAQNVGGRVRRWIFLARALPEVVPGVRFEQSYFGMAAQEMGHVEDLPQRAPVVLAAGLIGASALALGRLGLRALGLWTALGPGASARRSASAWG